MFKRFFERAAAKASLTNIKFELDRLSRSFPHSPPAASQEIFKLLENVSLAFSNHASVEEVRAVIDERAHSCPPAVHDIIGSIVELACAAERHDSAAITEHDRRMVEAFHSATGVHIDTSRMPWFSKMAMKAQP